MNQPSESNSVFVIGCEYTRSQLLDHVGSRQSQSGVIWGAKEPGCVIVTSGGRHSSRVGYADKRQGDGTWHYFGQGSRGSQDITRFSNRVLLSYERSVLLFTTRELRSSEVRRAKSFAKRYCYQGAFHAGSWDYCTPDSGPRAGDRLICVTLFPADSQGSHPPELEGLDALPVLQNLLIDSSTATKRQSLTPSEYYYRSGLTRRYAMRRANGKCEYCRLNAPFLAFDGQPFLEVHHIFRLADSGPDLPANVAALCPNCHRAAHHSQSKDEMRALLLAMIAAREAEIASSYELFKRGLPVQA